jgi:4-amino-4-deoxy-L-arabinose transferase-like glycosyltransferase
MVYTKNLGNLQEKINGIFNKDIIIYIFILALLLRLVWVLVIPTIPVSDFELMYSAKGNYTVFHGTSYFARFTHCTSSVLYFSLFYKFSENPLTLIKLFNVFFQAASVYFVYLLVMQLYNCKRSAQWSASLLCIFPPFIMFTSQAASENMAIPLYILSVYCFFKSMNEVKGNFYLIFCGLLLSVANLFRMVGTVFLVAYVVYLFLHDGVLKCVKKSIIIIVPFYLLLFVISSILLYSKITENHLWNPKESHITSILKGTNIKSIGQWNYEDAILPDKYNFDKETVEQESLKIIKERLFTTPIYKLVIFYILKLSAQWGFGDFGAYQWTIPEAENNSISGFLRQNQSLGMIICNMFLTTLLIKNYRFYKNNKGSKDFIDFFMILFAGFILLYLLTEMQPRYGFLVAWIFVIHGKYNTKLQN